MHGTLYSQEPQSQDFILFHQLHEKVSCLFLEDIQSHIKWNIKLKLADYFYLTDTL